MCTPLAQELWTNDVKRFSAIGLCKLHVVIFKIMVKNLLFLVEILSDSWADMERIQKDVDGLKLHKKTTVDQV